VYNDLGEDGLPITVTKKGGVCKHAHMFWRSSAASRTPSELRAWPPFWTTRSSLTGRAALRSLSADSDGYNSDTGVYWRALSGRHTVHGD